MVVLEKKAERLYNKLLKKVEKLTGDKTTYLTQLNDIGEKILGNKFHGVYPSDKIPKLNDRRCYCILNLDRSTESGSHWIALVKNGNESIIYDSFGRDAKTIIPDLYYSGNGKIIQTDDDSEQHIIDTNCGARSLCWLLFFDIYGPEMAMLI